MDPVKNDSMQLVPGGTGDPPVLGGNLPPSSGERAVTPNGAPLLDDLAGLVARPNRPMACSTQTIDCMDPAKSAYGIHLFTSPAVQGATLAPLFSFRSIDVLSTRWPRLAPPHRHPLW